MDDVLDLTSIERVAMSPDGDTAAVVVRRAARPGEVYGRTSYEIDPSRDDIWVVSRRTGARRDIIQGAKAAAGFWCATWSPDGGKLAMLSTMPEGGEPRGGDNVHLYVWDRSTGSLTRASAAAVMTQTRYGSPMYRMDLRGGADRSTVAHRCFEGQENAPFAWLDGHRLLAVMLPPGGVSGLIDQYSRPARHTEETSRKLRNGIKPTVTAVGSGAERMPREEPANSAVLRTIDVDTGVAATIATVPTYPFRGELTLSIAPDGRKIAVLATLGAIPPTRGKRIPYAQDSWSVEKRLGFVDLSPGASMRWAVMPPPARYPLELFGWSPDGRRVALRARGSADTKATPLFVASSSDVSVVASAPATLSIGDSEAGSDYPREVPMLWADNRRLLARGAEDNPNTDPVGGRKVRADWWLLSPGAQPSNLTATMPEPPGAFRRSENGKLFAVAGGGLVKLDVGGNRLETVPSALTLEKASIV
jgi:dipeptidyl aminopeptidase/acylaminoacyl peptidase